jgi:hypothetical protein
MPIERNSIFFRIFLEVFLQLVVERSDRCAFAGDLRGHALGDLAGGAVVHQDVEFGLALNVDEPGRSHQAGGVNALPGRGIMQVAHGGDAVAGNSNVAHEPWRACAVDDASAPDDVIELRLLRLRKRS